MRALLRTQNDFGLLMLRLALGAVFFAHGAQKVLGLFGGPGIQGTMKAFTEQMHLPSAIPVLVMVAEFGGSIALLLGLLTRLGALGIFCTMVAAIAMVHAQNGFFMNWFGNQAGEGFEYHLLAIGMALALMIRGGGALSVDHALAGPPANTYALNNA